MISGDIQRHLDSLRVSHLIERLRSCRERIAISSDGCAPIPRGVKRSRIRALARRYACSAFIKTGTYLGDTLNVMCPEFDEVHSIELSSALYERALVRFAGRNVHLHLGDSGKLLSEVLRHVRGRPLLWLDAHYSHGITARGDEDSPIVAELRTIAARQDCVIMVDDARYFSGDRGYPTLAQLEWHVNQLFPRHTISIRDDIAEIVPA